MSAGWVAAAVRGRGLARRRLGRDGARALAAVTALAPALAALTATPYGREVRTEMDLVSAQHAVSATLLWQLRVLAGWGPPLGAGPLRLLAAGFEIANVTGHLARLHGQSTPAPYALGSMATAWPSVSVAQTPAEVRAALSTSVWGDPGSDDLPVVRLAMQVGWARRVLDGAPGAADWAISRAALVVARVLANGALPSLGPLARRDLNHLLGPRWQEVGPLSELARSVPRPASQALQGMVAGEDLWRAEARWWARVESAGATLAEGPRPDASSGVGVAGLLAADAWRTRAALAVAAHGGGNLAEVLDAMA